jgi:hypothetical protein
VAWSALTLTSHGVLWKRISSPETHSSSEDNSLQAVGYISPEFGSSKGILEIIREKKILSETQIKDLLDPVKLSGLDKSKYQKK